jgi:hypothetical protein
LTLCLVKLVVLVSWIIYELRLALNPIPGPIAFIEHLSGGKSPTNNHEYLFGVSGKEGPEVYRNLIKFHTWLYVAQIVFLFGQIVLLDFYTLLDYDRGTLMVHEIGNIYWVVPELSLYSMFASVSIAQSLLAPSVFLDYCTATSIEKWPNCGQFGRQKMQL